LHCYALEPANLLSLINFFSFLVEMGFELRALHLQSRQSIGLATSPVHFALIIFQDWVLQTYLPGQALNCNSPDLSFSSS
jgi:hypothetical protein